VDAAADLMNRHGAIEIEETKFLLLAHGSADEVAKAKNILQTTHPLEVAVHAAKKRATSRS
jgi:hypothetical protein